MKRKALLSLLLASVLSDSLFAALSTGDIAVIGYRGDSADEFAWVPLVDLSEGEVIYFTDAGYQSGSGFQSSGSLSESLLGFTTPAGGISAGTVQFVRDTDSVPTNYTLYLGTNFGNRDVSTSGINLNQGAGDQVFVFQAVGLPSSPGFEASVSSIFALDTHDTPFSFDGAGATTTTDIYPGLTDGSNAVSANLDNTRYVGTTTGTRAQLLEAITNDANWVGQNGTPSPATEWSSNGGNFTVLPVPEPSTCVLLSFLSPLAFVRRRRSS